MEPRPSENKQNNYELTDPTAVEPAASAHDTDMTTEADPATTNNERKKRNRWTKMTGALAATVAFAGIGGVISTIEHSNQKPLHTHVTGTIESMEPVGKPMPDQYGTMQNDYIEIHFVMPDGTHVTAYAAESLTHGVKKGSAIDANITNEDGNSYLSSYGGLYGIGGEQ